MLKLLLIDDDEELCAELREVLETEGFKVDIALDGLQGFAASSRETISNYNFGFEIAGAQWIWGP